MERTQRDQLHPTVPESDTLEDSETNICPICDEEEHEQTMLRKGNVLGPGGAPWGADKVGWNRLEELRLTQQKDLRAKELSEQSKW